MIHRFKLHRMYLSDSQNCMRMDHLHKTACAKISDSLLLIIKCSSLCVLESRHPQVSKTIFILKFGPSDAKIINFKF